MENKENEVMILKIKNRLRVILAERNIKKGDLAKKCGISLSTVSSLVNEKSLPTLQVALKIAQFLGLYIEEIWEPEEEQ